ncbi:serine/threonine protein kinase [Cylindrospermum stagnale PCC 7417]|uniref:non-specific serine/threonine protein kinase n=1 Tax=Cylindrospermum stagnale PCC 7417 TaxID=56107 RepID=K9X514_9NOST|nr:serine/threonine-protein kinase [Cylindrospermum stagnale]AFZ27194.1 serine/threonine protein kinase [Cylindrospermum stagnale PCC 7417]
MKITLLNNRYQVIQVLGAGGFGETFLAEDTHMPSRRRCVIKQLKPITNDPQTYQMIQQRFEREAATLEYLGKSSDQIPELYAYFAENGQFYLVQEWILGQTLTDIVQSKGYETETAVRDILLSLLSVLDYVHSKGIIHRDIKPDNIILRSLDHKPVLIDFGAVKETIRSVVNSSGHPTQSLVIGTPGYMPSEQAIGRPVYGTDIYSLGLTAIYLLTGKHPQELEANPQTGEILWQNHAPRVSPQLAMVLNQAIKPHTSDRYSTASKMLYALQSASNLPSQSSTAAATISLSPHAAALTQPLSSQPKNPVIGGSSTLELWQKPPVIIGSLVLGSLIGGVILSNITRQPQPEAPIANNLTPAKESPTPTVSPNNPPISSQPSPAPVVPISPPQQQITSTSLPTTNPPKVFIPQPADEPETNDTPAPSVAATPQPEVENQTPVDSTLQADSEAKKKKPKKNKESRNNTTASTTGQSVPAFPTGTSRSSVEAALGKSKDLRGLWGNTRAVTYKLVPNQIDLGYLFDRNSGALRQTEAAFAQSVDPQVMQTTLNGMLNGQATEEIKQGLQQIQERQSDNFQFTQGAVKGQIVRQNCDFIYISIWDADLHEFVNPADAKQC